MSKYANLFNYFRQCPYLEDLMSIAAESDQGNAVILPQGASPAVQYDEGFDVNGDYNCRIIPYPSVYEDFQINCYEPYDVNDTNPPQYNTNVLTYEDVCGVCKWIEEQSLIGNFPDIGEKVISVDVEPFVPQVRGIDPKTNTVCYFITVRIRYINPREARYYP